MTMLIEHLAGIIDAYHRCQSATANESQQEWVAKHRAEIRRIESLLPSGSGIDCGTTVHEEESTLNKVVLSCSYHHMNEHGMYDGWTGHAITVRPSFLSKIELTIGGRDRNDIKEYLHDVYSTALTAEWTERG